MQNFGVPKYIYEAESTKIIQFVVLNLLLLPVVLVRDLSALSHFNLLGIISIIYIIIIVVI